eukprot:COSAG04_NODE_2876_length_3437_cov_6.958658_3_plen_60_part_00
MIGAVATVLLIWAPWFVNYVSYNGESPTNFPCLPCCRLLRDLSAEPENCCPCLLLRYYL